MDNNTKIIREELAKLIVENIETSIIDDFPEKISLAFDGKVKNGIHTVKWNCIYNSFLENCNSEYLGITANTTQRGFWTLVPIYDSKNEILYVTLHENRFGELARKKDKSNYLTNLLVEINGSLPSIQQNLFDLVILESKVEKNVINDVVEKIICDMRLERENIKNLGVILFEDNKELGLLSVRACLVNSFFEILDYQDLSEYISTRISTVAEKVSTNMSPFDKPSHGMKLTLKADSLKNKSLSTIDTTVEDEHKA